MAKSTAVPASSSSPQKVTVVKSADGRVIVKTSENLEKEALTKVVNTVTSHPTSKTVIVSTAKSSTSTAKEVEERKEASPSKKDEVSPAKAPTKESKKVSSYVILMLKVIKSSVFLSLLGSLFLIVWVNMKVICSFSLKISHYSVSIKWCDESELFKRQFQSLNGTDLLVVIYIPEV